MSIMTITSDEIEAVAARIDASTDLDAHDKDVVRALFLLAGEAASQAVADEDVAGFAYAGRQHLGIALEFTLPPQLNAGPAGAFTVGQALSKPCCTGRHFPSAQIND